jgi:Predicted nucleic-acid-binding protein containing a Zn-ribbon
MKVLARGNTMGESMNGVEDSRMEYPAEYEPYFNLLIRGELGFPMCSQCGVFHWYPRNTCPACGSANIVWKSISPQGRLFSWTTVHRKLDSEYEADVPYVVGLVEFNDAPGIRLVSRIVNGDEHLRVGLELKPVFDTSRSKMPKVNFEPAVI